MKLQWTNGGIGSGGRRALAVAALSALAAIAALSVAAAQPASAATTPPGGSAAAHATRAHTLVSAGYDMVGSDGGVFVFGSNGGFFGSLPGLGVHVNNIVGMVGSANGQGYFLVGSDGGVFSFGSTTFAGSLPGLGIHVNDIVGIVSTSTGKGYYLVGNDGGVFAFGDAPYIASLPSRGVHVNDITAIVARPDLTGYWLIGGTDTIYSFGSAATFTPGVSGNSYIPCAYPNPATTAINPNNCSIQVAGASTSTGNGLWSVDNTGLVDAYGDANLYGDLVNDPNVSDIVSIVSPFGNDAGYFLVGADGGIFSYGTTTFFGSLPGIGVHVNNVVGAVPTVTAA